MGVRGPVTFIRRRSGPLPRQGFRPAQRALQHGSLAGGVVSILGGPLAVEHGPGAVPGCRDAQPREFLDEGRVRRDNRVVDLRGTKVAT